MFAALDVLSVSAWALRMGWRVCNFSTLLMPGVSFP
jgi:hypothetical protein